MHIIEFDKETFGELRSGGKLRAPPVPKAKGAAANAGGGGADGGGGGGGAVATTSGGAARAPNVFDPSAPASSNEPLFAKRDVAPVKVTHSLHKALKLAPAPISAEEKNKPMKLKVSVKSGADSWSFVPIVVKRSARVR